MRLLVSVRNGAEAEAALAGGASIIDAKEPAAGALGPVTAEMLAQIRSVVPGDTPLSAALGDLAHEALVAERLGRVEVALSYVKLGFAGLRDREQVEAVLSSAVKLAGELPGAPGVIAVAYADWVRAASLDPGTMVEVVERSGARGLLVDTANKDRGKLNDFLSVRELAGIRHGLKTRGLLLALAGSLEAEDIAALRYISPDILGVRGAACVGGRTGDISSEKVARLAALLETAPVSQPERAAAQAARSLR